MVVLFPVHPTSTSRASKTTPPPPQLAQGLDPPLRRARSVDRSNQDSLLLTPSILENLSTSLYLNPTGVHNFHSCQLLHSTPDNLGSLTKNFPPLHARHFRPRAESLFRRDNCAINFRFTRTLSLTNNVSGGWFDNIDIAFIFFANWIYTMAIYVVQRLARLVGIGAREPLKRA